MKKVVLIFVLILFICSGASAQGFFKKVGKEAKDKTADRSEKTVNNVVDKAFNAIDNLLGGKKKDKDKKGKKAKGEDEEDDEGYDENDEGDEANPKAPKKSFSGGAGSASGVWDCTNPECLHKGNTGKFCSECGAKRTVGLESSLSMYKRYTTKKISFIEGSAELKFESFNEIQKIAEYMKNNPSARLIVQVLYFNTSAKPADLALAEDRAENIVKALVDQGCDEFSLKAEDNNYENGMTPQDKNGLKGMYVVFTRK